MHTYKNQQNLSSSDSEKMITSVLLMLQILFVFCTFKTETQLTTVIERLQTTVFLQKNECMRLWYDV